MELSDWGRLSGIVAYAPHFGLNLGVILARFGYNSGIIIYTHNH